jgi:hypothetical protein
MQGYSGGGANEQRDEIASIAGEASGVPITHCDA